MRSRILPWVTALALLSTAYAQETGKTEKSARERAIERMQQEKLEATTAMVKGRCVDGLTGKPLSGVSVEFHGWGRNSNAMAQHGKVDWEDPDAVLTGQDGRFSIRFVPPPPYQHSMAMEKKGYYRRTARWGAFTAGQVDDIGDVPFFVGHHVKGKIVDVNGAPLAGARIMFNDLCFPIGTKPGERPGSGRMIVRRGPGKVERTNASHSAANQNAYGFANDKGEFTSNKMIPAGTWPLRNSQRGMTLVKPLEVTIDENGKMTPDTIVINEEPFISGVVVDGKGRPVARVRLQAEQRQSGRMASARSGKDGTFKIYRTKSVDAEAVRIQVTNSVDCEKPKAMTPAHAWGTKDIRIELRRALSFPLLVVEKGTDKPVTEFAVKCHATRSRSSVERDLRLGGTHKNGKVVVDRVWRGETALRVYPKDPQLALSETIRFTASDESPGVPKLEVERLYPKKVTLVDEKGQPLVGVKVQVITPGTGQGGPLSQVVDPRSGGTAWSTDPNWSPAEVLSSAKTDKYGQCEIYGFAKQNHHILRVQHKGLELIQEDVPFSEATILHELVLK